MSAELVPPVDLISYYWVIGVTVSGLVFVWGVLYVFFRITDNAKRTNPRRKRK